MTKKCRLTTLIIIFFVISILGCGAKETTIITTSRALPWQRISETENISTNAIVIAPSNNRVLYAGTSFGVIKSTDSGASWTRSLLSKTVNRLVVDPNDSQIVYAGTQNGIYKSINGGDEWIEINTGLISSDVTSTATGTVTNSVSNYGYIGVLAISPSNAQILYIATRNGIFKTSNGGASWVLVNTGMSPTIWNGTLAASSVTSIAIDGNDSQVVYASTRCGTTLNNNQSEFVSGNVFKTTDGGVNWQEISVGIAGDYIDVTSVVLDPSNSNVLYAGIMSVDVLQSNGAMFNATYSSVNIYKSMDGGLSWKQSRSWLGGWSSRIFSEFGISASNSKVIYASFVDNVYKSNDNGVSWTLINEGLPQYGSGTPITLAIDPINTDIAYIGSFHGIYKTTSGGI